MKNSNWTILLFIFLICSCASLDVSDILPDPNQKAEIQLPQSQRSLASDQPLITYCAKETAAASTPEEKKWRDAFSLEVMERICNKNPEIAKRRIDYSIWEKSRYLETSWDYGIDLTGVEHGWPRGTLVTPRHMISTKHASHHPHVGETMWYLTLDNRMISRKVIEVKYVDNADIAVIRLESDVPGSVHPLRVLDPQAFSVVPDKIPVWRIEQQFKALLVEKQSWGFSVPGSNYGDSFSSPPGRAFAQYYQNMILYDSSSPSVLLLRNEYGVMPILYSMVTWGGTGNGPLVHNFLSEIQSTIQSFGDSHQLQKAMPPITSFNAPSCSVTVERATDGHSCKITVKGSADPVTGNPVLSPVSPLTWTASGNNWTGTVECPSDPATVFEATLSGPGGTGRACESAAIGPALPQCQLSATRRGSSEVCDISVTRLFGNPTQNPVLTPGNPSDWVQTGDTWTGTTSCALNAATTFSAKLTDETGEGPQCQATVGVHTDIPTCELTSRRIGYTDTCELTVTRKSGVVSGNPSASPLNPTTWTQNGDVYKGNVTCSTEDYSTFSARLEGPLGVGPVCKSPSVLSVEPEIVFCELSAVRQGLTNVCKLTTNYIRGWGIDTPVASPTNPTNWMRVVGSGTNYEGTAACAYNAPTQFSAYYPSYEKRPGRVCQAAPVAKIPGPACNLQVTREGTSNQCNYSLTAGSVLGTIASYNFNGGTTRTAWNGSSPVTGRFTCSQIANSTFNAYVWGPGGVPQASSCRATVPKLPPPACQLLAQRRQRTSICDLTLTGSGVVDTSRAPILNPACGAGRWSGNVWRGLGFCATGKANTFSARVFGPGGSQGSCTSNTVPRF